MSVFVCKKLAVLVASAIAGSVLLSACSAHRSAMPLEVVVGDGYASTAASSQQAVASVNPIATQAGLDAFAKGGNAIDAALAVAFTLGVVDSHNSGIGGGCFILARLASGQIIAIDGREVAPQASHRDMYLLNGEVQKEWSKTGALAVGIPGSVAALHDLQKQGGKLSFSDVLLPAAKIAEQGFAVDGTLVSRLARKREQVVDFPETAKIFLDENLKTLKQGDQLLQADLASSYRKLAKQGPAWFYGGEFAQKTAQWMKDNGGIITAADFDSYRLAYREPVESQFNGYTVYGFPPPSSGGVHVAQMLNILSHFPLTDVSEADRHHLIAEAMRLAFADRSHWLGDSDFVPVPKGLIDEGYAQRLAKKISLEQAAGEVSYGMPPNIDELLFDKHTTHIATADAEGNWVAITTTLNTSFGSKVVIPGTGVILNNQMDDFSAKPGTSNSFRLVGAEANSIAPGKRPLSSMSPTIVTLDDKPVLTLGAAGGPTIISQVLQVLVRHLALGEPIKEAVAGFRVHHQWKPGILFVESSASEELKEGLEGKGHLVKTMGSFGGTQAIAIEDDLLVPVAEPRVIKRNSEAKK